MLDIDSMVDMYNTSLEAKKANGVGWEPVLATAQLSVSSDSHSPEPGWLRALHAKLGSEDAALFINEGNVFLLLHESGSFDFKGSFAEGSRVAFSTLSEEEAQFLLGALKKFEPPRG